MPSELSTISIVDTHQHLWDLSILSLTWLQDPPFDKLRRNFLQSDYWEATSGVNITRTIYMEVDARPEDQLAEAEFVLNLCRAPASRMAGAILGGRPGDKSFIPWVNGFLDEPHVKGFREVLFDKPAGYCLREPFFNGVRHLGEVGLSFDIETPVDSLSDAIALVDACPRTQFILDHCGHPDLRLPEDLAWMRLVSRCAERDNVAVKISGAFSGGELPPHAAEHLRTAVDHLLQEFGPDRVVFGSDWPVVGLSSSFRDWTEAVWDAVCGCSQSELQKLFHENAVKIYRLA